MVKNECDYCYNVIYNSVPVLLFAERNKLKSYGISHFRIDFTIENAKKVENVLQYVQKPGRYTGGEFNSVIKDKNKDKSSIKYIDPNEKLNKLFGNINVQEVPEDFNDIFLNNLDEIVNSNNAVSLEDIIINNKVKHSSLGGLSKYRVEGFDNANLRRHYI